MSPQKTRLSSSNLPLASIIARKITSLYPHFPLNRDELLGVLYESLVRAERGYKEGQGAKFTTYAWTVLWRDGIKWARGEMEYIYKVKPMGELAEDSPAPPLPEETSYVKVQLGVALGSLTIRTNKQRRIIEVFLKNPTLKGKEIAVEAGTSPKYANRVLRKFQLRGRERGVKPPSC